MVRFFRKAIADCVGLFFLQTFQGPQALTLVAALKQDKNQGIQIQINLWLRHPGQTVADCVCLFLRDLSRKETFVLRLDKNQNLEGSGGLKLFRTKRQTQMFSYRNHNIALHKTIFAMPCYTKLEKNCRSWLFFDKLCGFSLSSRTTFALSKLVLVQRLDKSRRLLKIENFKRQSHLFPQTPPQHK